MNKFLYLNCQNGISGDMLVGTLLSLGADKAAFLKMLEELHLEGLHAQEKKTTPF